MLLIIFSIFLLIILPQRGNAADITGRLQIESAIKADKYAPSEETRRLELKMLKLINETRSSLRLEPLSYNDILANIARHHSKEMAEYDDVIHYSPVYGFGLKERVKPTFPTFVKMSENIAMGKSIEEIHQNLLESPLHYKNIINPEFVTVGVGIIKKARYLYYVTQIFSLPLKNEPSPSKLSYYFEKLPPSRPKVITKRWQQGYSFQISNEEKLVSQGLNFYQLGDCQRAIKKFKEALKINPDYFYALFNLGLAYLEENRLEEALRNFKKALVQKPKDAYTRYYIAWIYFTREEFELAEKNLLHLLKNNYDGLSELVMNINFLLGRTYDQMGKTKDAILHYEEFINQAREAADKDLHNLALAIRRLALLKERLSRRSKKKP